VERGTFGSPTFYVGDEIFFGKDRLREVEETIMAFTRGVKKIRLLMGPWYRNVIGFAIRPNDHSLIDNAEAAVGVPAIYAQVTPEIAAVSDARHLVCSLHFARMPGSAHVLKIASNRL
jgi:hypothetical protein